MTLEILTAARKVFGEAGIERLISAREVESKESYAQRLRSARSLAQA